MPVPGGESFAQSGNGRTAGYHGNVMVTDHLGVFVGLETSHGYMFDKHNWLGGGINVFVFPDTNLPTYMNVFVDYHNYLKERSSLVLGMKAGWSHAFNYDNGGVNYKNGIFFEPDVGWSWLLNSGKGLSIGLGGTMIVPVGERST